LCEDLAILETYGITSEGDARLLLNKLSKLKETEGKLKMNNCKNMLSFSVTVLYVYNTLYIYAVYHVVLYDVNKCMILTFRLIYVGLKSLPEWIRSLFSFNITSSYFDKSYFNNNQSCLIDRPEITLDHRLIDYNVTGAADRVLQSAKIPPGTRTKPVLGVVRGMGTGKTRCLEELRRELLQRLGVLPIGITFNSGQNFQEEEMEWGAMLARPSPSW